MKGDMEEYGYVMVGGHRLPVLGIHLCKGDIALRILIPGGFPGCEDASLTLFGHDNGGIVQMPQDVSLPPVQPESFGLIEISLGMTK